MQMRLRCKCFPSQIDQQRQSLTCGFTDQAGKVNLSLYMIINRPGQVSIHVASCKIIRDIYMWMVTLRWLQWNSRCNPSRMLGRCASNVYRCPKGTPRICNDFQCEIKGRLSIL